MREIKFRAWNKLAHKMACITALDFMLDSYRAIAGKSSGSGHLADIELMQYTGLKDSNEPCQDIYEGDILRLTYDRRNKHETHQVYYDPGKACFGPFHHFVDDEDRWMDIDYEAQVIGNIYENPELLLAKDES